MFSFLCCLFVLVCVGVVGVVLVVILLGLQIFIIDVSCFYVFYDSVGGKFSVVQLVVYLVEGSLGLGELVKVCWVMFECMVEVIVSQFGVYVQGCSCLVELLVVKQCLVQVFGNLQVIYLQVVFLLVIFVVGCGWLVGLILKSGVIIGLEVLCVVDFMNFNVQDCFVYVIVYEYVYIQQIGLIDFEFGDLYVMVLCVLLGEGIVEFIVELIFGNVGNSCYVVWMCGCEVYIESVFVLDVDSIDLLLWLYNYKFGLQEFYDFGYWVGYCIVKVYYLQVKDKCDVVCVLIQQDNLKVILVVSGWMFGMWMLVNVIGVVVLLVVC